MSPARLPPFTPRKIPGTSFCSMMNLPWTIVRLEGLGELKNPVTSSVIEPRYFPAGSIVLQPTTLPVCPFYLQYKTHVLSIFPVKN
jgi:hypothetical protein